MSQKSVEKFAELVDKVDFFDEYKASEDVSMGRLLSHSALFTDCRDELQQERFFPINLPTIIKKPTFPKSFFFNYSYYNVSYGNLRCCSDVGVAIHYVNPKAVFSLQYLIYRMHPFGITKNLTEKLPRKLKIKEIIAASDIKSYAPYYKVHDIYHNFTSSEMNEIEMEN